MPTIDEGEETVAEPQAAAKVIQDTLEEVPTAAEEEETHNPIQLRLFAKESSSGDSSSSDGSSSDSEPTKKK